MRDSGQAMICSGVPCATTWPPSSSGAGAKVEDIVGVADGVFIVLDDEDGVAEVAELFEGLDEAVVVALMKADGGLVEHVEHAAEA